LRVRLSLAGRVLTERSFANRHPRGSWQVALPFLRADLAVVVDVFSGELRISACIAVRSLDWSGGGAWSQVVDARDVTVARFAPSAGRIGGSAGVHPPAIEDARWGRSKPCSPVVLRFYVDDNRRSLAAAGQLAKQALFPDDPPFVFNTVACVGCDPGDDERRYNDPGSPWFNVFFGYYQIDCGKDAWSRPFAYRSAGGQESAVIADEIIRLGMADWIWFSNWMYGLPQDVAHRYSCTGARRATVSEQELHEIGRRRWHRVRLEGITVASCEEGQADGARRLVHNTPLDRLWRRSFGPARSRSGWPESFTPVTLEAVSDLCYWEDDEEFHTMVFGATARAGTDPAFLQAQLTALHRVIETSYPAIGFPLGLG
jgi:hypothetical protein